MSPRKKKPTPVPTSVDAALEESAPPLAPQGEAPAETPQAEETSAHTTRVEEREGVEPAGTVEPEAPETAEGTPAPGETGEAGEVLEPEAWAAPETTEEAGTAAEICGPGENELPAEETGGAVIEVIETEAPGEATAEAAEEAPAAGEAGAEDPGAEAPRVETIEAPAAAESPDLEASDEVEETEGEVLDTELARVLSTPTGLRSAIEALLFVTPEPLTPHRIARALEMSDSKLVVTTLTQLKNDYDDQKRGFQITETAEGYQMATREVFGDLILRLKNRKRRPSLSQAALETLAIIAYRQPIIRAEVEAVRGVESSGTIRNLIDMGMVEMVGRKEVLGRPPMYGTTEQFLQSFGLRNLSDLPAIGELKRRFAENENKPAEPAKAPEAPAAAADGAENPFQSDLPGQLYIEVPGEAGLDAGAPAGDAGTGTGEATESQKEQFSEPDDADAEPEGATLAAAADAPIPGGNDATPDRKQGTAAEAGREGNAMSDREPWETEEEDENEDEEEFEDDEDWAEDEDYDEDEDEDDDDDEDDEDEDEDEDDDEDDEDEDELDEVDLEDEEDEDEDEDEDDEDDDEDEDEDEDEELDEDEEDEDEEDEDEDDEDYEDEDEDDLEDEDDDEDEKPRRG